MTEHVLRGLLTLVPTLCTITLFVIAVAVILPRRRQHRPVRVPLTIGLTIGAVGLVLAVVNLVVAFSS